MFEGILHNRLHAWSAANRKCFPNRQQNAYQKQKGSLTTSFNLQETIASNTEYGSPSYVALLDTSGAFDNVRHPALFYKLHEYGINGKAFRTLINCYTNSYSRALVNGIMSDPFPVRQGIRQGGVLSTWMYLLFIDKLLWNLESSKMGSSVGHLDTGCPTMADDLTLIANNKTSLQNMINTVTSYANSWGYQLNESKCKFLVFNGNKKTAKININGTILTSCNAATHVGIELNTSMKSPP